MVKVGSEFTSEWTFPRKIGIPAALIQYKDIAMTATHHKMLRTSRIGIIKTLFPNLRKYRDQKTAKTKSQSTTSVCVLLPSTPFS